MQQMKTIHYNIYSHFCHVNLMVALKNIFLTRKFDAFQFLCNLVDKANKYIIRSFTS